MSSPLAKLSFLVLDDNPNMARIMRVVLKGFGAERVYEAASVAEAFDAVRAHTVDVAFVDYNLGALDGLAFVRLMRTAADSPDPHMSLMMLSAYSELHRVESARDAGAHDFLVKPVTPIEVYRKIVDLIEHPRPFVRAGGFFGPDRRRRDGVAYAGPERRRDTPAAGPPEGSAHGAGKPLARSDGDAARA